MSARIKLCGMTRAQDLEHAVRLGVDAVGLIFYPHSSRYVSVEHASRLLKNIPPFVNVVGVFVNPCESQVNEAVKALPLNYLQFHGDEPPSFCEQFLYPYIKSIPAVSENYITDMAHAHKEAAAILLDTPSIKYRGGSGQTFDWTIIPKSLPKPVFLAGGVNTVNVLDALKKLHIYGVDVCSGVEASPGIKDWNKMKSLVDACRSIRLKQEKK